MRRSKTLFVAFRIFKFQFVLWLELFTQLNTLTLIQKRFQTAACFHAHVMITLRTNF
ncbi:Uncharacterised protein [Vibrio cholerae]|nr:Uncharacterised protein [Vibrio cholerae]